MKVIETEDRQFLPSALSRHPNCSLSTKEYPHQIYLQRKKPTNGEFHDALRINYGGVPLLSKCHTVSMEARKCNLILAHKNSNAVLPV